MKDKDSFWQEYTDRNDMTVDQMEEMYQQKYGITRTKMNQEFISPYFYQDSKVLEVGCNVGNQLLILQKMGFKYLYGIDTESYAVELAKGRTKGINIIQSSAFDIPFKDNYFDYVMTSGLLIHIPPEKINTALDEIYRCSKCYILCFEYYAPNYTQISYRGHEDLLWKADFSSLFLERFDTLGCRREKRFPYLHDYRVKNNVDMMFLLKKT